MNIYILIMIWLFMGFVLGYIYSIHIKKSFFKVNDIVISMIAGLLNFIPIWNEYLKNVIVFKPKIKEKK